MIRLHFYFILFSCCTQIYLVQAQPNIDDLKQLITQSNATYKEKIQAYIELAGSNQLKNFGENLKYGYDGLTYAVNHSDTIRKGILLNNIGKAHYFNADYDSANVYYQNAIAILQNTNAVLQLADVYNNTAKLYRKLKKLPAAHSFYKKAFDIYTSQKNEDGIATIFNEEGVVYEYEENYDQAIKNYMSSLKLRERMRDSVGIGYSLNFIDGAFAIMQNFNEAINYNMRALRIRELMKDSFAIALSYSDIGVIYAMQQNFNSAHQYLEHSNEFARALRYPDLILTNLKQLSDIASDEKNFEKAFNYQKEYALIKDSIYQSETSKQVEEFAARYENTEKEKLIQEQEFAISRRNYWIAGIIAAFILSFLLGYSWYRRYKLKQAAIHQQDRMEQRALAAQNIIEAEEKERKRIASELHDGVGQTMSAASMNLSVLKDGLIRMDNKHEALINKVHAMVNDSCNEIRMVSHNLMPHALNDKNLSAAVKDFTSKIDSNVLPIYLHAEGFDDATVTPTESVLYRVIQEIVNNVLKHAKAKRLDISLIKTNNSIEVIMEDDGVGFDLAGATQKKGLGLQNIQSRIEWLQGQVEWDTSPGRGTVASIFIPLKV